MSGEAGQVIFVIWRESVEALLVIGILQAWLSSQGERTRRGRWFLWMGTGAGLGLALLLGGGLLWFRERLSDDAQEYFQTGMVFAAAVLIIQMVFWMRRRGRTLRRDLEAGAERSLQENRWWSLAILAALAVAREGSETVIFLYGIIAGGAQASWLETSVTIAAGLLLAFFTYWLLQIGSRVLSWRLFFRASEIMLLFLALALIMNGVDHLVSAGVLPSPGTPLWNSSDLLDDSDSLGSLIAALSGYRARPDLLNIGVFVFYWLTIWLAMQKMRPAAQQ
ncbi:MAG TPA: FTR1 family protein [Dongiaceae bacterium]|jgi:high-affinity iron transporter|nr:FTR1 family protein [Dongiaceae bacterium]